MSDHGRAKILVIRGGAIGDFLLTLPAIRLVREAFPQAHLEILGYEHIVCLAQSGGLADGTRSIEYAAMAGFFNPKAELDADLCEYFAGFAQIISFLYDPDGFFTGNLTRAGARHILVASPKIDPEGDHATRQLARPLQSLALYLENAHARLEVGADEQQFAEKFLGPADPRRPLVAIHPGSGGERKNWPVERWQALADWLLAREEPGRPRLLIIGGEADAPALKTLRAHWPGGDVLFAQDMPLPRVAALLARAGLFIGHDSGISHLAAAVGAPCVVLFGPTDPDIWAPPGPAIEIVRAGSPLMRDLPLEAVQNAVASRLARRPKE
jgi:heptosyltransferase-2